MPWSASSVSSMPSSTGSTASAPPAGELDGAHVGERDNGALLLPQTPEADLLGVGGDSDQRPHPRSNIALALVGGDEPGRRGAAPCARSCPGSGRPPSSPSTSRATSLLLEPRDPLAQGRAGSAAAGRRRRTRCPRAAPASSMPVLDAVEPGGAACAAKARYGFTSAPGMRDSARHAGAVPDEPVARTCGCRTSTRAWLAPNSRPRSACTS